MILATASTGFEGDIKLVHQDGIAVLHRWPDETLLVMAFDGEMPAFTTKPVSPKASLESVHGLDAVTKATGYVFHVAEPDVNGTIEYEGQRYSLIEIRDYVVWTDDGAVRTKYGEVIAAARSQE